MAFRPKETISIIGKAGNVGRTIRLYKNNVITSIDVSETLVYSGLTKNTYLWQFEAAKEDLAVYQLFVYDSAGNFSTVVKVRSGVPADIIYNNGEEESSIGLISQQIEDLESIKASSKNMADAIVDNLEIVADLNDQLAQKDYELTKKNQYEKSSNFGFRTAKIYKGFSL